MTLVSNATRPVLTIGRMENLSRISGKGGKRSLIARRSKAPTTVPLLQALQPDRVCGWPARLQARRFALPVGVRPLVRPTPTMTKPRGKSSDGDFTL